MAKPWGRIEIGFLGHPKFRALNANAICLWLEGKSYCDEHLNDGRFPCSIVRTFRFWSDKAVGMLTTSCGVKPSGDLYAPLWQQQDLGGVSHFVMHDYLDHNDCRDVVMARKDKAEAERERKRRYLADRRAAAKAARELATNRECSALRTVNEPSANRPRTDPTTTTTTTSTVVPSERRIREPLTPTKERPLPGFLRLRLFAWMVAKLKGSAGANFDVDQWLGDLENDERLSIPADDQERWKWLQSALDYELRTRGLLTPAPAPPTNKRVAGLVAGGEAFLRRNQA